MDPLSLQYLLNEPESRLTCYFYYSTPSAPRLSRPLEPLVRPTVLFLFVVGQASILDLPSARPFVLRLRRTDVLLLRS